MKFQFNDVVENPATCSVCGDSIQVGEVYYYSTHMSDKQVDQIEQIWNVDPFTEFIVCEECLEGHCGAVWGRTADKWLEDRIKGE